MFFLKRIYYLLLPEERRMGGKVAVTVFLGALLDFLGLAALLPILYYLLEDNGNIKAAMSFCVLAAGIILVKNFLIVKFTRFQNNYLLSS